LGVPVKCIDCAREQALNDARSALSQAGCIWVTGGNTFFLWHSMRASGLSELVRQRVNDEGALYVGASAGSIVAGRTIRTALWKGWDDPEAAGPEADWEADGAYDALGLVEDVSFFPHYDAASWGGLVDRQRRSLGHACVVLADDVLASAVRGGLLQFPENNAPAVAALDATGQLIGILKRLDSGSYRLRPNFLGEG
jgi:hypothetical protein